MLGEKERSSGILGCKNWDFTPKMTNVLCSVCRSCSNCLFRVDLQATIPWNKHLFQCWKKRSVTFLKQNLGLFRQPTDPPFSINRSLRKVAKSWKLDQNDEYHIIPWNTPWLAWPICWSLTMEKSGYVFKNWISLAMVNATLPCIKKFWFFLCLGPLTKPPPRKKGLIFGLIKGNH